MRPDIEWRIGETADEETIIQDRPAAAHWRTGVVLFVVAAGLGLGLLYSSVPEPPPRPAALPAPNQNLNLNAAPIVPGLAVHTFDEYTRFELLRKTVDREVAALADGAEADFLALQDRADADWLITQQEGFSAWKRPSPSETRLGTLYFYGGNTFGVNDQEAWIDIRQYQRGSTFRETRFYRWQTDHWVRVRPLLDFWNGASSEILTPHFRVSLPQADEALTGELMQRLEYAFNQICLDLACPDAVLTPTRPLRVVVSPALARGQSWIELEDVPALHIPSPRISGLLDTSASYDRSDPLLQLLYARLSDIVARAISGGQARWNANSGGRLYLTAVAQWELQRGLHGNDPDSYIGVPLLRGGKLTLPKYLWDWPVRDSRRLASPQAQANSVIAFIDRTFGAERVVDFLRTLQTAQSLPQAIEATLPTSYASFERQWQQWLKAMLSE